MLCYHGHVNGEQLNIPTTESPFSPAVAQQSPLTQPAADSSNGPIDAVVTWVDGSDPIHLAKRQEALRKLGKASRNTIPAGTASLRFSDNGELFWCLHSIRKFAPWIRHIHLVTDNQVPAFLTPDKQAQLGVRIVDHSEIFAGYEWALPTFNTRSIESMIWRIENVSERFIYFNDDFFLINPVAETDFFQNERVVCRGLWRKMQSTGPMRLLWLRVRNRILKSVFGITHTLHLLQQMRSAQLAGFTKRFYRIAHVPHPLRFSTLESFFADNPQTLQKNITHPFRSASQFSAIFLAYHLEILRERAVLLDFPDNALFSGEGRSEGNTKRLLRYLDLPPCPFLCLQSLEGFENPIRDTIRERLASRIQDKAENQSLGAQDKL